MIMLTRMIRTMKYYALVLVVASAGVYLSFLHFTQQKPEIVIQFEDDSLYFPDVFPHFSKDMLSDDFEACFFESSITEVGTTVSGLKKGSFTNHSNSTSFANHSNSTSFANHSNSTSFANHSNSTSFTNHSSKSPSFTKSEPEKKLSKRSLLSVLTEFADLMSTLKIKVVLIEPSMIYCMLSPFYKRILLKRKFEPEKYSKPKQVLTFGIREMYIPLLEKTETQTQITNANFSVEVTRNSSPKWMQTFWDFPNHLFFKRGSITVHAVVFHKRGAYLWHGGFKSENHEVLKNESLHFAEGDSAFESFIPVRPGFSNKSLANVFIPSDPHQFLFQIPTSKFLECNAEVVESFQPAFKLMEETKPSSPLVQHRFKMQTVAALGALKSKLNPLLMRFWIWSGTMLGWYRQCDLIPYTSDIDFVAWAADVDDLKLFLELFRGDDHLKLKERMGVVQQGLEFNLNCHNLRVDLFFLYSQSNGTWLAGHRPSKGYFFKNHYPHISLCSADLLGRKVLVPCEVQSIIKLEYGPNWMQPVSSWNYESSNYNRGPNIYWNESMLNQVFAEE